MNTDMEGSKYKDMYVHTHIHTYTHKNRYYLFSIVLHVHLTVSYSLANYTLHINGSFPLSYSIILVRMLSCSNSSWAPLIAHSSWIVMHYLPHARKMQLCLTIARYSWGVERSESTYNKKSSHTEVTNPEPTLVCYSWMDKQLRFILCQGLGPQVVDPIMMRYF